MRRVYGFMILALVVILGVLYVETDQRANAYHDGDDSVYRVVLGGQDSEVGPGRMGTSPSADPAGAKSPAPRPPAAPPSSAQPSSPGPPVAIPLTPDPPVEYRYTVRSGDTLGAILEAHLGSASPDRIERVQKENKLANTNQIRPGDILIIPVVEPEQHQANGSESLRDIAKLRLGRSSRVEALLKANPGLPTNDRAPLPKGLVIWIPR